MPPHTKSRAPKSAQAPQSRFANVNGVRLHYLIAGKGDPVVLLHGYAETSHMWLPLIAELAKTHAVVAPDLRGAGQSSTPPDGYAKAAMAQDIHALARKLGYERVRIVGHDIGLMVAYAYAAQYPSEVDRIVLMDAFLPGVGKWRDVWLMRDLWHFHFYGKTPLALVHGRERIYFEHFWNDFAANPKHSVPERDRRIYAKAYARPGGMRSGFEYFRCRFRCLFCPGKMLPAISLSNRAGRSQRMWRASSSAALGTGSWKKPPVKSSLNSSNSSIDKLQKSDPSIWAPQM